MCINYRKSDYSLSDQKILERYNRHQRGEWTKLEIIGEVVGAVTTMALFILGFILVIHL